MFRSTAAAIALSVLTTISTAEARNTQCAPITASDVVMFFDVWDRTLATGNARKVSERYARDAVLLPTLSEVPRKNRGQIEEYFTEFLKKHPRGSVDNRTIRIGCNEAFDAGLYTLQIDGEKPGERVPIKARYNFIYEVRNGRWVISLHQSFEHPQHATQPTDMLTALQNAAVPKDRCSLPDVLATSEE